MFDQNIEPSIGYYLAGFADGEGSFNVSFRPRNDYPTQWKISLCFNISQKDFEILSLFQTYLRCGTMRQRKDGVWYFEVNRFDELCMHVIPFFERFPFMSAKKQRDFAKFIELAALIKRREHLSNEGIEEVLRIRSAMNDGGKRKYTDELIREVIRNPQRLYAKPPQHFNALEDDIVRTSWRHEELDGNDPVHLERDE